MCRREALSPPATLLAFTHKKEHLITPQCKWLYSSPPEKKRTLPPPPDPASSFQAHSPLVPLAGVLQGPRRLVLLVVFEACLGEPGAEPHCLSLTQMRKALLLPSGSSDVKHLLLRKCHWQGTCGKVKSGNGRIRKHLAVCTNGRAVAHKRLLFSLKLSSSCCSSNLYLVHMTFLNP